MLRTLPPPELYAATVREVPEMGTLFEVVDKLDLELDELASDLPELEPDLPPPCAPPPLLRERVLLMKGTNIIQVQEGGRSRTDARLLYSRTLVHSFT